MSDLILLHQEMLSFILNALNLVEVPCLSLTNPSHPINILLFFLRTQILVKILVRFTLCHTYSSLCGLLCHLVLTPTCCCLPTQKKLDEVIFVAAYFLFTHMCFFIFFPPPLVCYSCLYDFRFSFMALLHTLRSVVKYMSPYAQLPVFAALLRQKICCFRFALNRVHCCKEFFYTVVPKNNSSS